MPAFGKIVDVNENGSWIVCENIGTVDVGTSCDDLASGTLCHTFKVWKKDALGLY
ncbi:MAG: hypothetical protein NVSMB64_10060 [Candidatus Velthaea sp.]